MKNIVIQTTTIALLGLFAGGCITVLFILLPFWHSLTPTELMQWFHNYGPTIAITMLPMQIIPFLLALYAYYAMIKAKNKSKDVWLWATISNIIILVMLLVYFLPVNLEFVNQTMNPSSVPTELARWEAIHAARTVLAVLSTVLGVVAFMRLAKNSMR